MVGERGDVHTYRLIAVRLMNKEGSVTSLLLTLKDITEEKAASESLKIANLKLNLLSSITRHDTLNQVTVIHSYGELLTEGHPDDHDLKVYGERITKAAEQIERQLIYAKDYHGLGVSPPEWQDLEMMFRRALSLGLAGGLQAGRPPSWYRGVGRPVAWPGLQYPAGQQ